MIKTEERYYVKITRDGKHRFYIQKAKVEVISERQARKADIKVALEDIANKRQVYDKSLLELIK